VAKINKNSLASPMNCYFFILLLLLKFANGIECCITLTIDTCGRQNRKRYCFWAKTLQCCSLS